jgi:agmatinase
LAEDRLNLPFTGLVSFLRLPVCAELDRLDADVAILGIPSDEGSPWKPGSRFAPRRIRELSLKYAGYGPVQHQRGFYDIDEDRRFLEYERVNSRIVDAGDSDVIFTNVERTFENVTRDVGRILKARALPVVIGGDHAVTYPVVRAYEHRLNVVHFDAHLDYRPFVHGVRWANGNPMRLVSELSTIGRMIQVGIRSLRTREQDLADSRARGNVVVTIPEFRAQGSAAVLEKLPPNEPVYVSIDVDVLDLPLVPGCASSEVEGLSYEELRQTLFAIAGHAEVVGFDVVEVNPMLDVLADNTSQIAAQLIIEFLGRVVEHPGYRARHPLKAIRTVTSLDDRPRELVIPAAHARMWHMRAGERVTITQTKGHQVGDFIAFNAADLTEFLSTSHTRRCINKVAVHQGDTLYTNHREPIVEIVEDTVGVHDILAAACDPYRYRRDFGVENHRSCRMNFVEALAEYDVPDWRVPDPVNLFQNSPLSPDGAYASAASLAKAGDRITLLAKMDLIAACSACPQDLAPTNAGKLSDLLVRLS